MIDVELSPEAKEMTRIAELLPGRIRETVNHRDVGMVIAGRPMSLAVAKWFADNIVFVIAHVTKQHQQQGRIEFDQCNVQLALELTENLPAGHIDRSMSFTRILYVVANSFGVPVICCEDGPSRFLHVESKWDGQVKLKAAKNDRLFINGAFNPEENSCQYVWAFSLIKYRKWFRKPQKP